MIREVTIQLVVHTHLQAITNLVIYTVGVTRGGDWW